MNYRDYKQFGVGKYYHIFNRGNEKKNIFIDESDFSFFITRLKQNLFPDDKLKTRIRLLPPNSFSLVCYCLMPNHFHFLIRQNKEIPISKLMAKLCTSYSKYFNKRYDRVGHVFQDQFKQVSVSGNSYLTWLSCYIHQNPKISGLVNRATDYNWSSYAEFVKPSGFSICEKDIVLSQFKNVAHYENFVESSYETIKKRKDLGEFLLN
ncbi:MAG: transposase [Candidatus Yanofskybacteria bacterium]|nr:transposase [Candidatus Yanofskybacteria bacterium]